MSATITKTAFAQRAGVTQAAVSIALKASKLLATPDGRMDPADPLNATWLASPRRQRRQAQRKTGRTPVASTPTPPPDPAPTAEPKPALVPMVSPPGANGRSGNGRSAEADTETHAEADRRDRIASADLKEQRLARERGELVSRAIVAGVFDRVYQVHTGQLKALAQKLGPYVVAAFELQAADTVRVQEIMDLEVRRSLAQIKRELDAYLVGIDAEPVTEAP